jgi:hypothetical protein
VVEGASLWGNVRNIEKYFRSPPNLPDVEMYRGSKVMLRGMGALKMNTPLHTTSLSPLLGAQEYGSSNASWRGSSR